MISHALMAEGRARDYQACVHVPCVVALSVERLVRALKVKWRRAPPRAGALAALVLYRR